MQLHWVEKIWSALKSCGYDYVIQDKGEYSMRHIIQTIGEAIVQNQTTNILSLDAYKKISIFYIGGASPALTVFSMTCHSHMASFYSYDPQQNAVTHQSPLTDIRLRRRYAVVQKAKDASVIGIIVGTLGVSRYMDVVHHLKEMIKKAGRKSYIFVVGKLSPAKLANFSEIQLFVLVSCAENSLIESKDFYQPVATPYELYLALSSNIWSKHWITDFPNILSLKLDDENKFCQTDEPHFSLITGRFMQSQVLQENETLIENHLPSYHHTDIIKANEHTQLSTVHRIHSASADFHKNIRTWHGLTKLEAETEASKLEIGQQGIACKYHNEEN